MHFAIVIGHGAENFHVAWIAALGLIQQSLGFGRLLEPHVSQRHQQLGVGSWLAGFGALQQSQAGLQLIALNIELAGDEHVVHAIRMRANDLCQQTFRFRKVAGFAVGLR